MSQRSPEHILYPAGHHAVGKTELCEYLVDEYGFEVVETGAMVRGLYAERDEAFADHSLGDFVKAVEAIEPGYFDKKLASRIDDLDGQHGRVIVNGMRSLTNIERAKQNYPNTLHSIVWMEAQLDTLYERYKLREGKDLTPEEFSELLNFDMELGLALIKGEADFTVQNDSTVEALRERADIILQQDLGLTPARSESAQQ
jgi:dephospho-CoA kinase